MQPYGYPPLAAVASSLVGWDGNGLEQKEDVGSVAPKPTFQPDLFASPPLFDESMAYFGVPFGPDIVATQYDMDAYRMGLTEYGITPAGYYQ